MHRTLVLSAVVYLIAVTSMPALAADESTSSSASDEQQKAAEIVVDEEAGTVRIVIDGKAVVVVDAKGLHVEGDVTFTGVTRDAGFEGGRTE